MLKWKHESVKMRLSILHTSYTLKSKVTYYLAPLEKVPRLLARNPQISNIKIDDVQTAILGISASVESATLWLSVKIGYDTAHLGKHIVIAL